MLWEVLLRPLGPDSEKRRVEEEFSLLTHRPSEGLIDRTARGYLLEGAADESSVRRLMADLLVDPLAEQAELHPLGHAEPRLLATVLLKPGVMDPAALTILDAARDLGHALDGVRTFRRYYGQASDADRDLLFRKILANEAIEQAVAGPLALTHLGAGKPYEFRLVTVPIRGQGDEELMRTSKQGQLSLSLDEMRTIQAHYATLGRDPTDLELETVAQTWSEHCSHKTLKGVIDFDGRRYENLLKETIFAATSKLRQEWGAEDWCVSVFVDNAGVVRFDERFHACIKVETHNRPSAIEPYGGANTGLGGVIRDALGTGLGAKPVANTDVFCFAPPDTPPESLPPGVLHPLKVMKGVVSGVRDYGNRMGIPTVNGAVLFDERYVANPLVFCGTVGLIPVDRAEKAARAGDLIVAVGGRTGRDGIHGATFSSAELTDESEKVSGGAVQIGNAIAEKKMMDVLLMARDAGLYTAITDCGAGGFSSAVGEMAERIGARVELDKAPLKYAGLDYVEAWISESQERMVLAVPPEKWEELHRLCGSEDVEAVALGVFEATGRLRLSWHGHAVGDMDLKFLHDGRPAVVRQASWSHPAPIPASPNPISPLDALLALLADPSIASKEAIIRQYDHEVQGGSVIKPLVGAHDDGPSDAAVIAPVLGSTRGLAIGCGIAPRLGDLDPYAMALCAIDEAARNVVAVGADPARVALLDNFCWGNTDRPEVLGSLVLAAQACHDAALAYRMPFISGKDSLKNEFAAPGRRIVIPPTLLITALGQVPDVRRCVTMDLKEAGNVLYLLGTTTADMAGSYYHKAAGLAGGKVPRPDLALAPKLLAALHKAITAGLVRSCHDLSEGGLAVAVAEMAFAGGLGADLSSTGAPGLPDEAALFAETPTRFLLECKQPPRRVSVVTSRSHGKKTS
ncbi:MAG: phosphoribosylformylglycinamidine synthase subunit PurL [Gemmataceae bacterium]|nr:phosphoribosylformylglycinamidine synthase subunit PurL [Gemmataceae bacterium]